MRTLYSASGRYTNVFRTCTTGDGPAPSNEPTGERTPFMNALWRDIRHATRSLRKAPGFLAHRHPHARPGDRRQRGDLLADGPGAPASAAGARSRLARAPRRSRRVQGPDLERDDLLVPDLQGFSRSQLKCSPGCWRGSARDDGGVARSLRACERRACQRQLLRRSRRSAGARAACSTAADDRDAGRASGCRDQLRLLAATVWRRSCWS